MFKERQESGALTMGKFLKNFGLGLVYIALSPLLLLVLLLVGVFAIVLCVVEFFASTIRFFQGKDAFPPFWEDLQVEEIKQAQLAAQLGANAPQAPAPASPAGPANVYVQQNYYNGQHPAPGNNPNSTPANTPIEANGYFRGQTQQPPVLDVTSEANPSLAQPNHPALVSPSTPQITANPSSNDPLNRYIEISGDDPKGGNS